MFWICLAAFNALACAMNVYSFVRDGGPAPAAAAVGCGLAALLVGMIGAAEISNGKLI